MTSWKFERERQAIAVCFAESVAHAETHNARYNAMQLAFDRYEELLTAYGKLKD
jgi:hypothetical protein